MSEKALLVPVFFSSADKETFDHQLDLIRNLLIGEAELLEAVSIGGDLPPADAVIFPQLVGEAYQSIEQIMKIKIPLLVVTSEFATVAMWDWEIVTFFKSNGLKVLTPYNLELTKTMCRVLALKREMKNTQFLVFQDTPGEGMQSNIFKRFYWWEEVCSQRIKEKFGISIEKRSFKKLAENAKRIPEQEALMVLENRTPHSCGVSSRSLVSAVKMYLAVKQEIAGDESIRGVGINCLNESFYSDTVPCFAWDLLFDDQELMWACEADTVSLLTQHILYRSLRQPVMTSNVYPFLIGMAALKHEKINTFPNIPDPDNHMLIAHCGYFGLMPCSFASKWTLRPKVLDIVDNNAVAVDARFPEGDVTLCKIHPLMEQMQVINGDLERYVQYPDSHCRNGGLIRVRDGHKLMDSFYSHHSCIVTGKRKVQIRITARILDLTLEEL